MNIFQQYGIRDVADVCLYAIELDENDDEIYIPALYLDTLKVSTVEQSAEQTSAQGGLGNSKLITWDYGKEITVNLEDALFTPSSQAMMWGGKKSIKPLKLYLRNFLDKEKDIRALNGNLKGAILTVNQFSDFLIIADRWPVYEAKKENKNTTGYVGETSIYCWLVNGSIVVGSNKNKIILQDLILFYREQTQKWYFFNGKGPTANPETWYKNDKGDYDIKKYGIGYQYGKDVFSWIRNNLSGKNVEKWEKYLKNEWVDGIVDEQTESTNGIAAYSKERENDYRWTEYEPVAQETYKGFVESNVNIEYNAMGGEITFLTQELYIDGYRADRCNPNKKYSDLTSEDVENAKLGFQPYRYNASIDVEYNTNIVPPQSVIYNVDQGLNEAFYIERIERVCASRQFCIDTDVNLKHAQYRNLRKYDETELTVFINPKTMEPYIPNSYEYIRENGQRITGNLCVIKQGELYYKWTRTKAKKNQSLGKQIVIDATHFPGTYRLVGETYIRDRFGKDQRYQFEIPLCKMGSNNNLALQADGEPTVFNMTLTALRKNDGVMMKLTSYDVENATYGDYISESKNIVPYDITPKPTNEILKEISEPYQREIVTSVKTRGTSLEIQTPVDEYEYDLRENDIVDLEKNSGSSLNTEIDSYNGKIHVKLNSTVETTIMNTEIRKDTINSDDPIGILIDSEKETSSTSRYLNASEYNAELLE